MRGKHGRIRNRKERVSENRPQSPQDLPSEAGDEVRVASVRDVFPQAQAGWARWAKHLAPQEF